MPLRLLAWLLPFLVGCSAMETFYEKEILGVYAPEKLKQKQSAEGRAFLVDSLNFYLSRSKEDRVRVFGPPSQCTSENPAGETCLWKTANQLIAFAYDRDGYARSWAYEGPQGQFTSQDAPAAPLPRAQPVGKPKESEWVHPHKPEGAFMPDLNDCQLSATQAQQDQKNFTSRSGAYPVMEEDLDRCLKEKGWIKGGKR
jgi:hypothetical protein